MGSLVSSFKGVNLQSVCKNADFVISPVKKTFNNLDDNVSHSAKVRYLWLHVCQQVRENPGIKERVFTVFSKYGVDRDVLEQLGLNQDSKETSRGNKMVCDYGGEDIPVVGTKRPRNESKHFSEKHISILMKLLADYSFKWKEICHYLNIPQSKVREILSTISSIEMCLSRVLREWIVGNHDYAVPATVESLQEALGSNIVGLGDVANNLQQCLLQHGVCLEENEPSTSCKRPCLDTAPLEVVSQTRDCVVREGKSNFLEVQVCSTSSFMKDDSPLTDVLEQLKLSEDNSYPIESSSNVSIETEKIASKVCDYGGGDVAVVEKRPHGRQRCFMEEDIAPLTEILTDCSSKYREIALCLRLPEHVREESRLIAEKYHRFIFGLERVLKEWIVGQHKRAKSPTVESLEAILSSGIVRETGEAEKLKKNLIQHGVCLEDNELPASCKRPCLDTAPLEVVSQTCDCVVREEKSTLLEVQVCSTSSLSYQWMKDGSPLTDCTSDGYSGTETEILCVNNASLSSEGTYSCEIKCQAFIIHSEPLVVTVKMSPLKRVLVDIYDNQPEVPVPEDSWPPVTNNTYINLALIKLGNIDNANEYTRYTIRNDMDDIYNNKDRTNYEEVFSDLPSGSCLLIDGHPGSGKSTLVHKFCQDWARGKLTFKNVKFVFLVHLREFSSSPDIQIRNIVAKFYTDVKKAEQVVSYLEEYSGEGLCFVLDGLNEYCPKNKKNTQIFRLINKEIYPKAVVVVASRPAATAPIRKVASKRVEVLGFLKEQISQYIDSYKFKSPGTNVKLRASLDQRQNVERMCYLPIHAVMVCYLFDIDGFLPRTETELYKQFTIFWTLNRSGRKYLARIEDLPNDEKEVYLEICKLSFEKTVSSKQIMKRNEVEHFFREVGSGNESLGLITVDCVAEKFGFQDLYTFLHLTYQEYLAAYHISQLEEKEQAKVVKKYGKKKQMRNVLKFLCGLVDFTSPVQFASIVKAPKSKDDLFSVQCAFESQQSVTCEYVASRNDHNLTFYDQFLTPFIFTAIGYVNSKAKKPVRIVLDQCFFERNGVASFFEIMGSKPPIKALCFYRSNFFDKEFNNFLTLFKKMDISGTNVESQELEVLSKDTSLHNLEIVNLSEMNSHLNCFDANLKQIIAPNLSSLFLQPEVVKVSTVLHSISVSTDVNVTPLNEKLNHSDVELLSACLRESACCTSLTLIGCNLDDTGAKTLANPFSAGLKVLKLSVNDIGDEGATALAVSLTQTICHLDLSLNYITDTGALAIAERLRNFTNLEELDLRFNKIGSTGAAAITEAIKDASNAVDSITDDCCLRFKNGDGFKNSLELVKVGLGTRAIGNIALKMPYLAYSLCLLNLESNYIDLECVKILVICLKYCSNLETLNLRGNKICNDGAETLVQHLEHNCSNLRTLILEGNDLSDKGLVSCLKHCRSLHELNLDCNKIGSEGVTSFNLEYCDLYELSLQNNRIGLNGIKTLSSCLQGCHKLIKLNLKYNVIGEDVAVAELLADGLQYCKKLEILELVDNLICPNAAMALADGLVHCVNLRKLFIGFNKIGSTGLKALASGLSSCGGLRSLSLYSNDIDASGAQLLANCLGNWNKLCKLDLDDNEIGNHGARALSKGLGRCVYLQELHLHKNSISADGATALANSLKNCSILKLLDISGNNIDASTAKHLDDNILSHATVVTKDSGLHTLANHRSHTLHRTNHINL